MGGSVMKSSRLVVALIVLSSVGVSSLAGATGERSSSPAEHLVAHAASPTGNPAVIAYYRQVVAATRAADGVRYTYDASAPFDQLKLFGKGRWSVYSNSWPHAGFYGVDDTAFAGARNGRVTFVSDTLVWGGRGPNFSPFGEVLTALGEVELYGNAEASTTPTKSQPIWQPCAGSVHGPVAGATKVGGPSGYGLYGDFRTMKRVGANEVVVSTFPYGKGHVATETDVIDRATHLPVSGTTMVSGAPGQPAYTTRWTLTWYHVPIYPPRTDGTCATIYPASVAS